MARQYYYYKALRKTIIQFLDIFNDIEIARYDKDGNFEKYVEVPVKFALKEKVWYWMNERKYDEMLPMISVALNNVELAKDRIPNRYEAISLSSPVSGNLRSMVPNPMPYDISFAVSVWALYMTDVDQIIEQIVSFFAPDIFMRIRIDEIDFNFDVKVLFNSASPEMDLEMPDEMYRVVRYSLDFTCQSFFFRPIDDVGIIKNIYINYYMDEDTFGARDTTSTFTSGGSASEASALRMIDHQDGELIYQYELWKDGEMVGKPISGSFEKELY